MDKPRQNKFLSATLLSAIERDFPHFVDVAVPLGGFGKRLDAVHEWHRSRGIEARQGRGQREEGQNFIRWCFADPKMAADFAGEFGGTIFALGDQKSTSNT